MWLERSGIVSPSSERLFASASAHSVGAQSLPPVHRQRSKLRNGSLRCWSLGGRTAPRTRGPALAPAILDVLSGDTNRFSEIWPFAINDLSRCPLDCSSIRSKFRRRKMASGHLICRILKQRPLDFYVDFARTFLRRIGPYRMVQRNCENDSSHSALSSIFFMRYATLLMSYEQRGQSRNSVACQTLRQAATPLKKLGTSTPSGGQHWRTEKNVCSFSRVFNSFVDPSERRRPQWL